MILFIARNSFVFDRSVSDEYFVLQMLYNIPSSGGVFLAYIVPAYLLAGLHREDAEEPIFSGGSLLGKVFFQYIGTYNRASKLIANTGINDDTKLDIHIFFLLGYMLLYLFSVQTIALGSTYLIVRSRHLAASLTGAIFACMSLAGGYLVHTDDVGIWASWLRYASPQVFIFTIHRQHLE